MHFDELIAFLKSLDELEIIHLKTPRATYTGMLLKTDWEGEMIVRLLQVTVTTEYQSMVLNSTDVLFADIVSWGVGRAPN